MGSEPACVVYSGQNAETPFCILVTHPCVGAILAHCGPEEILVDETRAEECFNLLDREVDTAAISTPHVEQTAGIPVRETCEVSSGCEGLEGGVELTLLA